MSKSSVKTAAVSVKRKFDRPNFFIKLPCSRLKSEINIREGGSLTTRGGKSYAAVRVAGVIFRRGSTVYLNTSPLVAITWVNVNIL